MNFTAVFRRRAIHLRSTGAAPKKRWMPAFAGMTAGVGKLPEFIAWVAAPF
jgi:hypothetical protein